MVVSLHFLLSPFSQLCPCPSAMFVQFLPIPNSSTTIASQQYCALLYGLQQWPRLQPWIDCIAHLTNRQLSGFRIERTTPPAQSQAQRPSFNPQFARLEVPNQVSEEYASQKENQIFI